MAVGVPSCRPLLGQLIRSQYTPALPAIPMKRFKSRPQHALGTAMSN
jgi:hypothetical protein